MFTLQGINISPDKAYLKMIFLFPRWDMLVSWRVYYFDTGSLPGGHASAPRPLPRCERLPGSGLLRKQAIALKGTPGSMRQVFYIPRTQLTPLFFGGLTCKSYGVKSSLEYGVIWFLGIHTFLYIYIYKYTPTFHHEEYPNVGKYTSPMDLMEKMAKQRISKSVIKSI